MEIISKIVDSRVWMEIKGYSKRGLNEIYIIQIF